MPLGLGVFHTIFHQLFILVCVTSSRILQKVNSTSFSMAARFNSSGVNNICTDVCGSILICVGYAIFVEEGSRNNKAHHMLRRAATEHGSEYKQILEDAMKHA